MYIEDVTQILKPRKNILFTILYVTSILLRKWHDVKTPKSRDQKTKFTWFVILIAQQIKIHENRKSKLM